MIVDDCRFCRFRGAHARVVLLVLIGVFALSSCGSDGGSTDVQVTVPRITQLSHTVLAPGDTLAIEGSGFASPASSNLVVFNNSLATVPPYSAADTMLHVVVPQNANSGPLHVSSKGVSSNSVDVAIEREVGDVWVMSGGVSYEFTVPVPTGAEEYLIVAEGALAVYGGGRSFTFQITPDGTSASVAPREPASIGGNGHVDFATAFEAAVRNEPLDYMRKHPPGRTDIAPCRLASAAPQTAQFYVLKCTGCSTRESSNYEQVTATLEHTGAHALIYADVNQPTGSFGPADYAAFGQRFDNEIYPVDTNAFGEPTDIDQNGKIIILFTPVVNDLTPDGQAPIIGFIGGFVLLNDLGPNCPNWFPPGTTNGAEIFYSMVPDPNGEYGNVFPKSMIDDVVPGILAHEFEHMISNGYRFVTLGGGCNAQYVQETWLEEGMAHMAEDLNVMDSQNVRRANLYLAEPQSHSLLGNAELYPYIDTLEQRGGIFLFLRYLADRYGEGILKTMVQSQSVGIGTVEMVTGVDFHASINDYLATLYLSGRGIASDPTYEYTSLDIPNDFGGPSVTSRAVSDGAFNGTVRTATGNFFHVTGAWPPALHVRVSSSTSAAVRVVITRIQ
jgi:hypothetical protein